MYICHSERPSPLTSLDIATRPSDVIDIAMAPRNPARPPCGSSIAAARWGCKQLLKMDWCDRHDSLDRLRIHRPLMYERVMDQLSPDEALQGQNTGVKINPNMVFIVADKCRSPGRVLRQTTLHVFFVRLDR